MAVLLAWASACEPVRPSGGWWSIEAVEVDDDGCGVGLPVVGSSVLELWHEVPMDERLRGEQQSFLHQQLAGHGAGGEGRTRFAVNCTSTYADLGCSGDVTWSMGDAEVRWSLSVDGDFTGGERLDADVVGTFACGGPDCGRLRAAGAPGDCASSYAVVARSGAAAPGVVDLDIDSLLVPSAPWDPLVWEDPWSSRGSEVWLAVVGEGEQRVTLAPGRVGETLYGPFADGDGFPPGRHGTYFGWAANTGLWEPVPFVAGPEFDVEPWGSQEPFDPDDARGTWILEADSSEVLVPRLGLEGYIEEVALEVEPVAAGRVRIRAGWRLDENRWCRLLDDEADLGPSGELTWHVDVRDAAATPTPVRIYDTTLRVGFLAGRDEAAGASLTGTLEATHLPGIWQPALCEDLVSVGVSCWPCPDDASRECLDFAAHYGRLARSEPVALADAAPCFVEIPEAEPVSCEGTCAHASPGSGVAALGLAAGLLARRRRGRGRCASGRLPLSLHRDRRCPGPRSSATGGTKAAKDRVGGGKS